MAGFGITDESISIERRIVQKLVDNLVAKGESGVQVFEQVQHRLAKVCAVKWHLICFDETTHQVLPIPKSRKMESADAAAVLGGSNIVKQPALVQSDSV